MLVFQLFISPVSASNAPQELTVDERQKLFERFNSLQKDIYAVSASVSQEKQLAVLKEKVFLEGTVVAAKPNLLRWEVNRPERSVTVVDGERMIVYHPVEKEAQVYVVSENLVARNAVGFFSSAMGGSLSEMEKKFSVTVLRKDGEIICRLIPLSKMAGRYLSSVTIYYDEMTGLPRRFEMETPKGDRTVTKLTSVRTNPRITSETFKLKLPDDVWITNKIEPIKND